MSQTHLEAWQDLTWPEVKTDKPLPMGEGVIDQGAFNIIEVDKLFDAVNHATTTVGQAALYRSLARPSDDVAKIQAKQEAIKELKENQSLKAQLQELVEQAATQEGKLYLLLFGQYVGSFTTAQEKHEIEGYGYREYRNGVKFVLDLMAKANTIDKPKSAYLAGMMAKLKDFTRSREYTLMQGPVYVTEGKIRTKAEQGGSKFPVPVIFKPTIFKPFVLVGVVALAWFLSTLTQATFGVSAPAAAVFLGPLSLLYLPIVGGFDRENCINPLRNLFKKSEALGQMLDALGQLDELMAFIKFAETFPHSTTLPVLESGKHHRIKLAAAVNPVLGKQNPAYVANDFRLDDEKLVLLTGPNSGGKTAFCKTITQIQVLAQIGCFVPAKSAELTVADRIFYQVPEISHLDDGEGRFGTELKRTKDIFLATTALSLVVLDELSEGTTFEEKMEASVNTLNGFYRKGNSTVLITHNHQLVDVFAKEGTGVPLQVEFAQDAPTYRLISGISRISHAARVAKKIGFSKEDIDSYLAKSQ